MNHLVGLDVGEAVPSDDAEIEALRDFTAVHEAARSASWPADAAPAYRIDPSVLGTDGWRPLDSHTLLRFLRADKRHGEHNPGASTARLRNALAWRVRIGADGLLSSPPPGLESYRRYRIRRWVGRCHMNRPVMFERLGQFLGCGNTTAFGANEWLSFYTWDLEGHFMQMREASEATATAVSGYLFIGDLAGMGAIWRHMRNVVPLLKQLTKEVESNYPEIAGPIVLFNAPRIFAGAYRLVRPFLDPITADKIEVHAGVPLDRLLELMPPEAIPAEYGGCSEAEYPLTEYATAADDAGTTSSPRYKI